MFITVSCSLAISYLTSDTEPRCVFKGSNTQTVVDSQPPSGENTTLVPSQESTRPPTSIPSVPLPPLPPLPSARTQQDTDDPGTPADDEMDVADISYILDMDIYWDEMPHTPGKSTCGEMALQMLIPVPPLQVSTPGDYQRLQCCRP